MTEHAPPDPNEPPEDVASLYSWANLHGGKYRDFSASRAEIREKTRQRTEQTIEEERLRAQQEAEAQPAAEAARTPDESRLREFAAQQAAQSAAQEAAQRAAQEAAQQRARQAAELAAQRAAQQAQTAPRAGQQAAWPQLPQNRYPAPPAPLQPSPLAAPAPLQEGASSPQRAPWLSTDANENTGRPAWLMPDRPDSLGQPALPPGPEDTLQSSRDRLVSRWFALRSVFEDNVPAQSAPAPTAARAPVLAVFSLAGGVGKTSLVATLGRVLSARGERVLLVDTAAYGLLPFFFGARDQRPGLIRTFSPPVASGDAPIQMITLDPETLDSELATSEALTAEILKHARGVSRVIIDLATASGATTRRIMRLSPQILVPLVPDMCSVVSVSSIDAFFDHNNGTAGKPALPYYVLNQFDPSLPLHLDVREVLREQLGDRLLPFTLRHTPAVSEALAEGMTVMDYAPNSAVTEDFASLAGWVKSLSAPASTSFRGVRWSER
ncbi:MAG TPA: cellulose synthase operon protein YhjQ/BcsQ [Terracidiphilus sp.]|nr:cellulose synthase operon protein YhjQ/BcsQ [Terracidiphilus sp.]